METVKVDIQKLQLLNDRIAQTIDALNQVRMSVHGIHHTGAPAFSPFGYGLGTQSPFAAQQAFAPPYVPYTTPYAPQFSPQFASQFGPGIQHTQTPYGMPFPQQLVPGIQHTTGMTQPITTPTAWTMPYTGNGISHSSWDPSWQSRVQWGNGISHTAWDPTWQSRVAQTWPLLQIPFTPSW